MGVTLLPTIAFPRLPGGIAWALDLTVPVVNLFPADGPLPNPLTLGVDQLAVSTNVTITIGCIEPTEKPGTVTPLQATLEVIAIASPLTQFFSPGVGDVFLRVDDVLLPEVTPPWLQVVLDCLIRMILEAALSAFPLPLEVLDAGFFKLTIEEGPTVSDNQIKLRGGVS